MEKNLIKGFCEMSQDEIMKIEGGSDGVFGFLGDIYNGWCDMWHDFGANLYHLTND